MRFQHYKLGNLDQGSVVEVILEENAANVRLLDDYNFRCYKSGKKHSFHGGYIKKSPFRINVPCSGIWHVVIDIGGYPGRIKSNVRVI